MSISNSEVGLASLSLANYILRLICSNGLISKSQVSSSYRHVSYKILDDFPGALNKIGQELGKQREQFRLSMDSPVDDPESTLRTFNSQFGLPKEEREIVLGWAWQQEAGENMLAIINSYTKASQYEGLSAEAN